MNDLSNTLKAVDLFCGVGGLTHGFRRGGISVAAGVDLDGSCRFAYERNNSPSAFIERDVNELTAQEVLELFGGARIKLLAGCAPCQPFSTYSRSDRRRKGGEAEDGDWSLVASFGRLIREVQPELVTMENVPQLLLHSVFGEFLKALTGYHVTWSLVDCERLGVPQKRKRMVLMASRLCQESLSLPEGGMPIETVRSKIAGLPHLGAGQADGDDPLHIACKLSPLNLQRIQASKPGGTWRDWPESLRAACHQKSTGATYPSVYGRMEWDKPAPTITTQCFGYGNGRFGHPEQDRAITLREAAILQTFPPDYAFLDEGEQVSFARLGRLIGNAVPVRLGEIIADTFRGHLAHHASH
ncbi:MAG: DNA cytosine methyltransferase [Phenylobacterium sp.]|uniref:DNA cytosine methyltransferase n=1 Tax=Phenylobacterium sp. TaxID=1871053 RepID=UPI0025F577FC|nr:DNA cytosine methyltransferase [Phenylobacterium sp.]MCA6247120.1 DNA cytosine methyltransferase [Phenylobacterium sp.]MCA6329916.1 DNA cytosine methyltransferase [Phenylobacterium sp.]